MGAEKFSAHLRENSDVLSSCQILGSGLYQVVNSTPLYNSTLTLSLECSWIKHFPYRYLFLQFCVFLSFESQTDSFLLWPDRLDVFFLFFFLSVMNLLLLIILHPHILRNGITHLTPFKSYPFIFILHLPDKLMIAIYIPINLITVAWPPLMIVPFLIHKATLAALIPLTTRMFLCLLWKIFTTNSIFVIKYNK